MTAKTIKLFENQPPLEDPHIKALAKRGYLVPEESLHKNDRREIKIANKTAGDVVSYRPLDELLRHDKPNQDDARRLLAIETARPNGRPRRSHISRLLIIAFASDKAEVVNKIETISRELWGKNRK
mgnify:CR=1 FL=1|tara:strand:- start:456 stop:833 length:378 start_codon:yes stop_codon:yes gene_type:complete